MKDSGDVSQSLTIYDIYDKFIVAPLKYRLKKQPPAIIFPQPGTLKENAGTVVVTEVLIVKAIGLPSKRFSSFPE